MTTPCFTKDSLNLDCAEAVESITKAIRKLLASFRRRGLVVALSGGIDSSVTAALCVNAVGANRVFGIHMPDKDSSDETLTLSQSVSTHFKFDSAVEDITLVLAEVGCYDRQEKAIQLAIPEYGPGWKSKLALENNAEHRGFNVFNIIAQSPDGSSIKKRLGSEAYLGIVAATNFKQRVRKMLEYYHADRLNYATTGTPNRLEYDQGFFVKLGDGAADIKPIAHLYKTQVYQLAEYLGVPEQVRQRPPTTDTYSLPQSQEEFYFLLPYDKMDLCLYAKNHGVSPELAAPIVGMMEQQVARVYKDVDMKRSSTLYLHLESQLVGMIEEINKF